MVSGSGKKERKSFSRMFGARKACYKCGNVGHLAADCGEERLCFNCKKPGHESPACPLPRTFAHKQCFSCGGIGHIQNDCPTLRIQGQTSNQKCYQCGRLGHIARLCPLPGTGGGMNYASRAPPQGRLNTSTLPPVICFRCRGPNHLAKDCLANPTGLEPVALGKGRICFKCQKEGHIARDCTSE